MALLFVAELADYISVNIESELYVDDPVGHEDKIPVNLNISIPRMHCKYIGLDIQDDLGRHDVGFVENTNKVPIDGETGCRFEATFHVNKVPGNFHVSTHSSGADQPQHPDMTHVVHSVIFGSNLKLRNIPASFNPLEGVQALDKNALSSHDYFMKVVPTVYRDIHGNTKFPYQYTFARKDYINFGHGHIMPAIWFRYDLSPITVRYTEKRKPLYSFLTMVCAIVGGTFTVAGILDSCIFTAHEIIKKIEIGKLS